MEQVPPHERPRGHQRVAEALAVLDRPPGRVAHHYLAAGLASRAVPYVVRAVEIAGALGAFRDALGLVDGVRDHAGPEHLPFLLARRGDLLMALGDPGAVEAYTEAARVTTGTLHRLVRARLARAAAVGGDLGYRPLRPGGAGPRGRRGRHIDSSSPRETWRTSPVTWRPPGRVAAEARERLRGVDDPWHLVDLVGLHGSAGPPARRVVRQLPHRAATYAGPRAPGRRRLRRPPVRGREPALRPRALSRDHRRGRGAPAAGQPGRRTAGGGLRHRPDR